MGLLWVLSGIPAAFAADPIALDTRNSFRAVDQETGRIYEFETISGWIERNLEGAEILITRHLFSDSSSVRPTTVFSLSDATGAASVGVGFTISDEDTLTLTCFNVAGLNSDPVEEPLLATSRFSQDAVIRISVKQVGEELVIEAVVSEDLDGDVLTEASCVLTNREFVTSARQRLSLTARTDGFEFRALLDEQDTEGNTFDAACLIEPRIAITNLAYADEGFSIEWESEVGAVYTVERSVSLEEESWSVITTNYPRNGALEDRLTYVDSKAATKGEAYYRISVIR